MAVSKALFSRASDEWATPKGLFDRLNARFSFDLDAAASPENALCRDYYTLETDGLAHSWEGRRVWCNPPYSRIGEWTRKFREEAEAHACLVAALIPARTDTRWWHENVATADLVHFLKGRLRFGDGRGSAPFPSALAFWFGLSSLGCGRDFSAPPAPVRQKP